MTVVCLDLDGTLEDSREDMVAAVQRLRARLGLPPRPDADFRPHVNQGMDHLYARCFPEHLDGLDPDDPIRAALAAAYAADYGARIADTTALYPGMAETLAALADRWPLALVTNKPEALSAALLAALHVADHFATIIGGDTLAVAKPHPDTLAEAVRRAGPAIAATPPAIMIGDSAGDIRCARDFGVPVIWCAWGYAAAPGPLPPDATAHHPAELPALVETLRAR
ncbi:MAG: HAD-IA family hydrolase [bacterium]